MKAKDLQPGDFWKLPEDTSYSYCMSIDINPPFTVGRSGADSNVTIHYPVHNTKTVPSDQRIDLLRLQL
jgi:hypothetical protein